MSGFTLTEQLQKQIISTATVSLTEQQLCSSQRLQAIFFSSLFIKDLGMTQFFFTSK